jgi:hypothetical protein
VGAIDRWRHGKSYGRIRKAHLAQADAGWEGPIAGARYQLILKPARPPMAWLSPKWARLARVLTSP